MAMIIKFPGTNKSIEENFNKALELEHKKNVCQADLNLAMNNDQIWEKYIITQDTLTQLAHFGEMMRFDDKAAGRLITRLAERLKVIEEMFSEQFGDFYE